ncbi:type ISP restriction/modification enzyme [Spongiactinospora rosea]|uniref:type ISP restriction/modification enzyme n=1 Tax=Spongiactinospora rosea TaxID=2248750 RepID=UPI001CEC5C11
MYLNDCVRWREVPAAVWDYKIGGFPVLRKWLSYREKRVLKRDLIVAEARAFTDIVRRLTAFVLYGPKLDANYLEAVNRAGVRNGVVGDTEVEGLRCIGVVACFSAGR